MTRTKLLQMSVMATFYYLFTMNRLPWRFITAARLSFDRHITDVLASCGQTMLTLWTLQAQGVPPNAIYTVFQAVVEAKLCYAGPCSMPWYGYATAADQDLTEASGEVGISVSQLSNLRSRHLDCRRPSIGDSISGPQSPTSHYTTPSWAYSAVQVVSPVS